MVGRASAQSNSPPALSRPQTLPRRQSCRGGQNVPTLGGTPPARRCRRRALARTGASGAREMTLPRRHWRSYGTDALPTPAEAVAEPFSAFPSWFLRITCDRCGKDRIVNEAHAPWRDQTLREVLRRARHDGCGSSRGSPWPSASVPISSWASSGRWSRATAPGCGSGSALIAIGTLR
jgi:hypothetical protein